MVAGWGGGGGGGSVWKNKFCIQTFVYKLSDIID